MPRKTDPATSTRDVMIVMPAFRAEATLRSTFEAIPTGSYRNVLLVDDCSDDRTVEVAEGLGISVIRHDANRGYGANQKTCYRAALETDAEIIVMLHPDNQYDPRVVPLMAEIINLGICDMVLGSRIRSRRQVLAGGMPKWKYFLNRSSTLVENFLLGTALGDFHSGYRAYRRNVLETIPFAQNSDDFAFDQEFIIQARHFGFEIGDLPVPVRYFEEASSINLKRSLVYAGEAMMCICALTAHRIGVRNDRRFIASTAS